MELIACRNATTTSTYSIKLSCPLDDCNALQQVAVFASCLADLTQLCKISLYSSAAGSNAVSLCLIEHLQKPQSNQEHKPRQLNSDNFPDSKCAIGNAGGLIRLHIESLLALTAFRHSPHKSTSPTIQHRAIRLIAILALIRSIHISLWRTSIHTDIAPRIVILRNRPAIRHAGKPIRSEDIWRVLSTRCYASQLIR